MNLRRLDDLLLQVVNSAGKTIQRLQENDNLLRSRLADADLARQQARQVVTGIIDYNCPDDLVFIDCEPDLDSPQRTWVINLIDGETDYRYRLSSWSLSVAVIEGNEVTAAAVYHVPTDLIYYFSDRRLARTYDIACMRGIQNLGTRSNTELTNSLVLGEAPELLGHDIQLRNFGSLSLHLAFVAAGKADLAIAFQPREELWLPGAAIVKSAGGKIIEHNDWKIACSLGIEEAVLQLVELEFSGV